jgi:hypothetical protein
MDATLGKVLVVLRLTCRWWMLLSQNFRISRDLTRQKSHDFVFVLPPRTAMSKGEAIIGHDVSRLALASN